MIEARLEKRRRTELGPPPGKRLALFVDDVNMPALEAYGASPPVELLRLLLDRGGLFDRAKPLWKDVVDVTVVCACGPPGGGRNPLTPRFVRHHHVLAFPQPSAASLRTIFSAIFGGFTASAPPEVRECVKPLVESSIGLYADVAATLLPVPAKPHYTFNLRDLSKVAQGVLRVKAATLAGRGPLLRLWWHECLRTFHDRLVDADDRRWCAPWRGRSPHMHMHMHMHTSAPRGEPGAPFARAHWAAIDAFMRMRMGYAARAVARAHWLYSMVWQAVPGPARSSPRSLEGPGRRH